MLTALQLIFEPSRTWEVIARKERGILAIFCLWLLPSIAIACALEGWGLWRLGNQPTNLGFVGGRTVPVSWENMLRYEIGQVVVSIVTVLALALLLYLLLKSFHCRSTFRQSFTVMAYSYGPLLLMQAVDGIPAVPTWVCRIIGAVLAAKVFYIGLVRVVRPDPTVALGVYFLGAMLLVALAGISHFAVLQLIEGHFQVSLGSWLTGLSG